MKLTVILLTVGFLNVSASAVSQNVTFSGQNVPLKSVFVSIEKQTGFLFFYPEPLLEASKPITINEENIPLERFLTQLFKHQPFDYTIKGKNIFISPKSTGARSSSDAGDFLPPIPIRIRVTDPDGQPLAGATISSKNNVSLGITSAEGVFSLNANVGDVFTVSFIGFSSEKLTIKENSSLIIIVLKRIEENLNEVVINKGYYTELNKFSTGNVSTITSKDIEKQPIQNPLLALQGRVPGIVVTQLTGMNGGGVQVRIQGQNSFQSGLDPLIVIDGVPYPPQFSNSYMETIVQGGSPLNYINTSDIESISVLKDADATAIYGSRAANGAILITSKKGKAGKPKLSVDVQQGWSKVTRHLDMMNTRQYLDMRYEAYKNDGLNFTTESINSSNYDLKLWDTTRYTDWQKVLIGRTARYTNINVGVSGGTNLVQYLIGASFNNQTTVFPGDFDNKAGGLHFNLNGCSPNQRLRIQLTGSYQYNQNSLPGIDLTSNAVLLEPLAPKLHNEDGSLNWAPTVSGSSSWTNPLVNIFYKEFSNSTKNLIGNLNVSYAISPGLILSSNFGYNNLQSDLFQATKLEASRPERRSTAQRNATFGSRNLGTWIIEPQLQYGKTIGKGKLDALIGSTIQKSSNNYLIIAAYGQPTNELLHSVSAATSVFGFSPDDYITRFNGLFGRVNYNWNKKYLINLTARRDGSSKFGAENRFRNFWSAGAGWIFSEEKLFQSSKSWLSFGKLRASYGITGNDQITNYSYLSLYNVVSTDILYQGTTSFNVAGFSNPYLQWEETRKLQGGIDLSAFNERIALSITFARNRSSNQLITYVLPDITGFNSFTKNFPATIENRTWEFAVNTVNIKGKNFNWSTSFNLTIPRNKVINFPGIELTSYATGEGGVIIGEPIGIQKKYKYGGVDPATGSYMLLDTLGKAIVPTSTGSLERSAKVSLLPKYYGGFSNTLNYKGFQLDFLFQFVYQIGAKDYYYYSANGLAPGRFSAGGSNQPETIANNHWQKPGDIATIGRFTTKNMTIWPYSFSNEGFSYAAGSYIRLKNLSLSWQLPSAWLKKAAVQTAKIYFRGQNLATITKYTGLDPETRSINTLPPLQTWTIGARIEL